MSELIDKSYAARKEARINHRADILGGGTHLPVRAPETRRRLREVRPTPFTGLLTNRLLASLPGEDLARLLPYLESVALSTGDYIYGAGDEVEHCYFLETAVISQIHLLEDGNMTEVALIGNEGMTGLSAVYGISSLSYWSEVLVAGTALMIHVEAVMREFHRGAALQRLMLAYTSARLAQLSQRAVCNGRHALMERLCTWLLTIDARVDGDQLMLTHEQIARHLGARRASISVAATHLKDTGIITYNRGRIRILDREALKAYGCECYRTLHHLVAEGRPGSLI